MSTLYFTKDILLGKTSIETQNRDANIILLDVQSKQELEVLNTFEAKNMEVINNIPIVTMRMHRIHGKLVNQVRKDTAIQIRKWILYQEFYQRL